MHRGSRLIQNPFTGVACCLSALAAASASAQSSLVTLSNPVPTAVKSSTLVGHLPSSQTLHVAVSLSVPRLVALQAFVNDVNNPASPNFRKFLTPAQVGQQFGPAPADVQKVVTYLKSNGFTVKLVAKSGFTILADATAAQAETAFNTKINKYHSLIPNDTERVDYYSYATQMKVPSSIAQIVSGVDGVQNRAIPHPQLKSIRKQQGPGYLTPVTTSVLYDTADLHTAAYYGQGRTVAISNWDGFHLANVPFYVSQFGLVTPTAGVGTNISVVEIDGGSEAGATDGEGDLDIQMVIGQAPLANVIIYDGSDSEIDVLTKEADDNLADTLSESYGWGLDASGAASAHVVRLQMSAQGQTYFCASGDDGANVQIYPEPDLDPEVTVVGGTTVTATTSGSRISEIGWSGSGGGWMTLPESFNKLPTWQVGTGVPTFPNYRLFPDVSLDADPNTGELIYLSAGTYFGGETLTAGFYQVGGTSEASPMFASAIADVEQYLIAKNFFPTNADGKLRFGELNPVIYAENGRSDVWFDVTQGSNGVLPNGTISEAGIGWDTVTGWGPMNFYKFASTLNNLQPQTIPANVKITNYDGMGTITQGASTLLTGTGAYLTEQSTLNSSGQVAATALNFTLTAVPPTLTSLTFTLSSQAPANVTRFIYFVNPTTGVPDLIATGAQSGNKVTDKILVNIAKYRSGKSFKAVVLDVYPARLGNHPYTEKIYQATVTESF
jgi:subtilase family serine protease